jgi:hypothetical protein
MEDAEDDALVRRELERLAAVYEEPRVLAIDVRWSTRMRSSLARAYLERAEVRVSMHMLDSRHLQEILAHEVAHIVCYWRHGRTRPHGREWRDLMLLAGLVLLPVPLSAQAQPDTLAFPLGLARGPDNVIYWAERNGHVVRRMDLQTGAIVTVAGTGQKASRATAVPRARPCSVAPTGSIWIPGGTFTSQTGATSGSVE